MLSHYAEERARLLAVRACGHVIMWLSCVGIKTIRLARVAQVPSHRVHGESNCVPSAHKFYLSSNSTKIVRDSENENMNRTGCNHIALSVRNKVNLIAAILRHKYRKRKRLTNHTQLIVMKVQFIPLLYKFGDWHMLIRWSWIVCLIFNVSRS